MKHKFITSILVLALVWQQVAWANGDLLRSLAYEERIFEPRREDQPSFYQLKKLLDEKGIPHSEVAFWSMDTYGRCRLISGSGKSAYQAIDIIPALKRYAGPLEIGVETDKIFVGSQALIDKISPGRNWEANARGTKEGCFVPLQVQDLSLDVWESEVMRVVVLLHATHELTHFTKTDGLLYHSVTLDEFLRKHTWSIWAALIILTAAALLGPPVVALVFVLAPAGFAMAWCIFNDGKYVLEELYVEDFTMQDILLMENKCARSGAARPRDVSLWMKFKQLPESIIISALAVLQNFIKPLYHTLYSQAKRFSSKPQLYLNYKQLRDIYGTKSFNAFRVPWEAYRQKRALRRRLAPSRAYLENTYSAEFLKRLNKEKPELVSRFADLNINLRKLLGDKFGAGLAKSLDAYYCKGAWDFESIVGRCVVIEIAASWLVKRVEGRLKAEFELQDEAAAAYAMEFTGLQAIERCLSGVYVKINSRSAYWALLASEEKLEGILRDGPEGASPGIETPKKTRALQEAI